LRPASHEFFPNTIFFSDAVVITDSKRTEEIYQNIISLSAMGIDIICLDEAWRKKPEQCAYHEDPASSLTKNVKPEYANSSITIHS